MPSLLEIMSSHVSVRRFRDEPVPDDDVQRAVAASQMASSSSHVQAYSLIRVRDAASRSRLVELTGGQPYVSSSAAFFVICADERRHRLIHDHAGSEHARNLETFLVAVIDASLFAQNLALAFESMSYGICFIGGLRNALDEVDELLDLPEHVMPIFGLCVGVPEERGTRKPRLPVEAVLFEERYPSDAEMLERIDRHDETMAKYDLARGLEGRNWSKGILRKFRKSNRTHLHRYYTEKGAVLE